MAAAVTAALDRRVTDAPRWHGPIGTLYTVVIDCPDPRSLAEFFPGKYHIDILVNDIVSAEREVLALGATRPPRDGEDFRSTPTRRAIRPV